MRSESFAPVPGRQFAAAASLTVLFASILLAAPHTAVNFGGLPLAFEKNLGQADPGVVFVARGDGYALLLRSDEARFRLGSSRDSTVVRVRLEDARSGAPSSAEDPLPGKVNYFTGDDPARWTTGIATYRRVRFNDVYPGISVVYYGSQQRLEYDFLVAPGADPGRIRLHFQGAGKVRLDASGDVVVETRAGELRQMLPVVYQQKDGRRQPVAGRYVLAGANRVAFRLGRYDRTLPLRIDPVYVFSTLLGGRQSVTGGNDYAKAVTVDPAGNIYIAGSTQSSRFPVSAGSVQVTAGGSTDAFVTKLNPSGTEVIYSTYLGSERDDEAFAVAADAAGNAYVTGYNYGGKFPVTAGAFQTTYVGARDAFVARMNPTGTSLVYCTLLGGTDDDYGYAIAVDQAGNAFVAGSTASATFPLTAAALQRERKGFNDAFVAKINPSGSTLVYSTLLGGDGSDAAAAVAVDSSGQAYVTGSTFSTDFPTSPDAYRKPPNNGAYLAKLNAEGSALVYSTILHNFTARALALDSSGQAYVAGYTVSTNAPVTGDGYQRFYGGGTTDGVVLRVNAGGTAISYGSYFGGTGADYATGIALDSDGNIILAGYTDSRDLPLAGESVQMEYGGGSSDGFVAILGRGTGAAPLPPRARGRPAGLLYATYFGGNGEEQITSVVLDRSGRIVVAGHTGSADLRVASGALQAAHAGGGYDAFFATFDRESSTPVTASYLGGGGSGSNEEALGIALDGQGNVYVTGRTFFGDFRTTPGAVQTAHGGGITADAYVMKLGPAGTLVYATYLGGSGEDRGAGIAVDSGGNAYVAGETASANFPTTAGAYQTRNAGGSDAFVAKLNPSGSALLYSTLVGGSGQEVCNGIAVDAGGDAYITGRTGAAVFPTSAEVLQGAFGGAFDAFVTRLNAQGTALVYSTFLGGASQDEGIGIRVDGAGNAYVCGLTYSSNFPTTSSALQTTFTGGDRDGFVAKLNPTGSALVYSTLLGGSGVDEVRAIAINAAGNAYVAGRTASSNFPATAGVYQNALRGSDDVFVAKLNPGGTSLEFSTFLGGTGGEYGLGIALDNSGNIFVTGITGSGTNFPVSQDRVQRVNRGSQEAFLSEFDSDAKNLLYSSYLGGLGVDRGNAVAADGAGNVYIAGQTLSTNFPTTANPLLGSSGGGAMGFLIKIDMTVPTDLTNVPTLRTMANPVKGRSGAEVSPGQIVSLVGEKLAKEDIVYARALDRLSGPLPYVLGGTSAAIMPSGPQFPLFQVHPTVIVAQLPYDAPLSGTIRVSTEGGDADAQYRVEMRPFTSLIAIRRTDGSEVTADTPLDGQERFYLYTTGFAFLEQPWPSGVPAPDSPLIGVHPTHMIKAGRVGSSESFICSIYSYDLAPGLVGVARLETNVGMPALTAGEQWQIWAEGEGYTSNKLPIYVKVEAPKP
ncbi:MAG: SBBP repeat-containing protein [Bryobacteraceae bacterium]